MRKIKKGIYILIVIALSLVTSSPFLVSKSKAVNWCGEYYDPGNPFPCCTQGGNCTWWAIYKRKDLRGVVEGDAGPSWLTQAVNNGYTVQTSIDQKVVGSIAVWGSHVAYVESLGSNGKIFITEMNCESSPPVRSEAYEINVNNHAGTFYGFILRKEVNIKPNIIGISKVDSGSNSTAVHVLNRDTNYQSYLTNTGTVLHQTGNNKQWVFLAADYDSDGKTDIYAINRKDTGSNSTAVHILDGSTNYQSYLLNTATVLHQTGDESSWDFGIGDFNTDGKPDIYALAKTDQGSNSTAIHILNGASNFQNYLTNTGTALPQTGNDSSWDFGVGDFNNDGKADVYAFAKTDQGSNSTAVHVLNAASNFQNFLLQTGTVRGQTGNTDQWDFGVKDYNNDGKPDIFAINKVDEGSNSTAVHVLNGASNFQNYLLQTGTIHHQSGLDDSWEFII